MPRLNCPNDLPAGASAAALEDCQPDSAVIVQRAPEPSCAKKFLENGGLQNTGILQKGCKLPSAANGMDNFPQYSTGILQKTCKNQKITGKTDNYDSQDSRILQSPTEKASREEAFG